MEPAEFDRKLLWSILQHLQQAQGPAIRDEAALREAVAALERASGLQLTDEANARLTLVSKNGAPMPLRTIFDLAAGTAAPAPPASGAAAMEEAEVALVPTALQDKFRAYLAKLKDTIYFKDIEPDTPAWHKRLQKAREKFLRKYGPPPQARDPEKALELKNRGNERLAAGDHVGAEQLYTEAIALDPENHLFFSNRAAARQHLGRHEDALADAREAAKLKPDFVKAYMRIGHSLVALGRHQEAADEGFAKALELAPGDAAAQEALNEARAHQRQPPPAAAGAPGAGGGLPPDLLNDPNLRRMAEQLQNGGGGGLENMMQNPEMMRMAMEAMQNPAMQNMMNTPLFQNLAQQAAQDPDMLRNIMGGMGGGGGGGAGGGGGGGPQ